MADDAGVQADELDHEGPAPVTVVGIGCSAGGLAALRRLLGAVEDDTGIAWVVVVHLSPEHESRLAELLQHGVGLPVMQVTETTPLHPDTVYVIPPNANLNSIDTHLRLSPLEEQRRERAPVDHFFRTLARTHDGDAVGVVLTGTGSDGTLGLREIHEAGGLTVCQDPREAEYSTMPHSAVAAGVVDVVTTLDEIPGRIVDFVRTEPRLPDPEGPPAGAPHEAEDGDVGRVLATLRAATGRDFAAYKRGTMLRRLRRRMQLRGVGDVAEYVGVITSDPDEVIALADDLLITVTSFFRDPDVFEYLEEEVVPELFADDGREAPIRVWDVACATGEEVYSTMMLLVEAARRAIDPPRIQVFATDLHQGSLDTARDGFYPPTIAADVSPERLERHFEHWEGGYRVRAHLREPVVFSPHDLLSDPPFSRLDMIVCRNLLIYLERHVQRSVIELFHYALRPDGILVLGTSESIDGGDLFTVVDKDRRVYRRRRAPSPAPRLPVFPLIPRRLGSPQLEAVVDASQLSAAAVHRRLIERHAAPSLLITADDRVVHLSEHLGRYLVHPSGEPTADVMMMVRDELRAELRAALHELRRTGGVVRTRPCRITVDGRTSTVTMDVRSPLDPDLRGFALVVFDDQPIHAASGDGTEPGDHEDDDPMVAGLRRELADARLQLESTVEEHGRGQEELRAANEELQSSNEELRSMLEELETGKEELQSINEELQTVNEENRHKVEELSQLSSDLQNLLAATDIATLFLDRELRIMRFTPRVADLFSIRPEDRGRPLSDITHRLRHDGVQRDALRVLDHLVPVEREIQDHDGNWFLTRILPYRSTDDRIEGVVLTFVDVTVRRVAEERYRTLFESMDEGYCVLQVLTDEDTDQVDLRFLEVNPAFESHTGIVDAAGRTMRELVPRDEERWLERYERIARTGEPERFEDHAEHLGDRWFDVYAFPMGHPGQQRVAALFRDVTERRRVEQELRALTDELEHRVEERTREVRELSDTLTVAEQQERGRLSQLLHDDLQQLLYGIQMQITMSRDRAVDTDLDDIAAANQRALVHLDEAIARTRQLTVDLNPPILQGEGLADAIEWLRTHMRDLHGMEVEIHVEQDVEIGVPALRVLVFQVVRELLFNVAKHAEIDEAVVTIDGDESEVRVSVVDHGTGFDPVAVEEGRDRRSGLGLTSARERLRMGGAALEIESSPEGGTHAVVRIPASVARDEPEST